VVSEAVIGGLVMVRP